MNQEVYVARQAIFDAGLQVVGYELLFRSNRLNQYDGVDGTSATNSVIANSFLLIGMQQLTNGKRAFINFTTAALQQNLPSLLPRELIAVEILEGVEIDETVVTACERLKRAGYLLVLDDFVFTASVAVLLPLVDIVKVDFRNTSAQERTKLLQQLKAYSVKLLAEKVESQAEFTEAVQAGYAYFQGYFFCQPVITAHKQLSACKVNYLALLQEVNRPSLDFRQIEHIVKQDMVLAYQLLQFINAPLFGFPVKIRSLHQAVVLLGADELKKWIALLSLKRLADGSPNELIRKSLLRAKFCEILALENMPEQLAANAFLLGMLSHLDGLVARPLQSILTELQVAEDIKAVLLEEGEMNMLSIIYKIVAAYEVGDWDTCRNFSQTIRVEETVISQAYKQAVLWSDAIMGA